MVYQVGSFLASADRDSFLRCFSGRSSNVTLFE